MINKFLKLITVIGNILCVYRSYCSLSLVRRCLVWVRILVELAIILACITTHLVYFQEHRGPLTYLLLTLISSLCILLLATYHCKNFECLTKLINENHSYFITDEVYCANLDRKYNHVIVLMIAYPFVSFSLLINFYIKYHNSIEETKYIIYCINTFACNIRYMFEYIALYSILFILSEQLDCIRRSICKEKLDKLIVTKQIGVPYYTSTSGTIGENIREITSFEDWTTFYTNIKECSNLFNAIFGVEITIILATVVFYLIIFLYAIAYISINGSGMSFDLFSYIVKTFIFLLALCMLSRSAQMVQHSVDRLKRCLGRLLIHSTEDLVCYKETKDLLRLISSRHIKTQAFGSICIDMSLVPKFVMFFTSYTVIALQFNNVV